MDSEIIDKLWSARETVYRVVFTYLQNESDCLEVVSETYAKAVAKNSQIQNPEFAKTWLIRIAINAAIDYQRKRRNHLSLIEADEFADENSRRTLNDELLMLPIEIRTVVVLRFYEDMKLQEIADVLQIPLSTVKYRLYQGLDLLRIQINISEGEAS